MKNIFTLLTLLIISTVLHAQPPIGLRTGVNFSDQYVEKDGAEEARNSKAGFMLGMYFTAAVNDKIAIQPEIMFSKMGSEAVDSDLTYPFNYLSIPVFFKYNISRKVHVHAGPQFGVLLTARIADNNSFVDVKESFKGTEWGANGGIGVNLGRTDIGVRYYYGLSNIVKDATVAETYKNSALQLIIGYRLSQVYDY
jgi:hypothetical protein